MAISCWSMAYDPESLVAERLDDRVSQPTYGQAVVGQDQLISHSALEQALRANQSLARLRWGTAATVNSRLRKQSRHEARVDVERFSIGRERTRVIAARLAQRAKEVVRLGPHLGARNGLLAVLLGQVQRASIGAGTRRDPGCTPIWRVADRCRFYERWHWPWRRHVEDGYRGDRRIGNFDPHQVLSRERDGHVALDTTVDDGSITHVHFEISQ